MGWSGRWGGPGVGVVIVSIFVIIRFIFSFVVHLIIDHT